MREVFSAHLPLTSEEETVVWKEALVIPDTNVLLGLYRYSDSARDSILQLMRDVRDRLWLPHHVGVEYFRKRTDIIQQQIAGVNGPVLKLDQIIDSLVEEQRQPHVEPGFVERVRQLRADLASMLEPKLKELQGSLTNDSIRQALVEIFDGRVGEELPREELDKLEKEAAERNKRSQPPGYMDYRDARKEGEQRWGDLWIWMQILAKAE